MKQYVLDLWKPDIKHNMWKTLSFPRAHSLLRQWINMCTEQVENEELVVNNNENNLL